MHIANLFVEPCATHLFLFERVLFEKTGPPCRIALEKHHGLHLVLFVREPNLEPINAKLCKSRKTLQHQHKFHEHLNRATVGSHKIAYTNVKYRTMT